MGSEADAAHLLVAARAAGSQWPDALLHEIHRALSGTSLSVQAPGQCEFLHFGTTRQLLRSGLDLQSRDHGAAGREQCLDVNNDLAGGTLSGQDAWVEGCRIRSDVSPAGANVLIGVDVDEPLHLPPEACLDVLGGREADGRAIWFVRCYGIDDTFKDPLPAAGYCGMPLAAWLEIVGASPEIIWAEGAAVEQRTLWNARVFPAEKDPGRYRRWLWVFDPAAASAKQHQAWRSADRYSAEQIAALADPESFHQRRAQIRAEAVRRSLRQMFRPDSELSAAELMWVLSQVEDRVAWLMDLLTEARSYCGTDALAAGLDSFALSRILHTLGSCVAGLAKQPTDTLGDVLGDLAEPIRPEMRDWLSSLGVDIRADVPCRRWGEIARGAAFGHFGRTIISSGTRTRPAPRSALRPDEIVWGRAPARIDLGGGWTDTPPYALERGGCVINAAVDLNGQPPIHTYARMTPEPVIRIGSIDQGKCIEITELDDLLSFQSPASEFSLAKAALALSGFSPEAGHWPSGTTLAEMLKRFGGGVELTTLAAIPKGSGLGTSSIVGAVLLAVVERMMGRRPSRRELFHGVLRLEQALTTGGGWQDQIGGAIDGVKVISTEPGLVPEPQVNYVPADVVDPQTNDGSTLLYYTGITRLARNILQQVVGRYLDRDRRTLATLRRIHALPNLVADAMAQKDLPAFGRLIDEAWQLNKQLDPQSTTPEIEQLLAGLRGHLWGAKLLGAGGGGFLLLVCKSPQDAEAVRNRLEASPPNDLARFFAFTVSRTGLAVTVS